MTRLITGGMVTTSK